MSPAYRWVEADWAAPPRVRAVVTTRVGGASRGARGGFNLAAHVGDAPEHVAANRAELRTLLALPGEPLWLRQVHGTAVVVHDGRLHDDRSPAGRASDDDRAHDDRVAAERVHASAGTAPEADAAVTFAPGRVLAVLTADCLPVVLASRDGTRLGVAHAGWRGLAAGVLERTVEALGVPGAALVAWLGPAIGPAAFEVGAEVRAAFVDTDPGAAAAFQPNARGRWQADLGALARRRLRALGVGSVAALEACTHADAAHWFSYRREPGCGRMATLAWIDPVTL